MEPGVDRQRQEAQATRAARRAVRELGDRNLDFLLTGEEEQDVTRWLSGVELRHGLHGVLDVVRNGRLEEEEIDRVRAVRRQRDDRRRVRVAPAARLEKVAEGHCVDGGRRDEQPELRSPAQHLSQQTEEHVRIQAALVRLVDHQGRVTRKQRVGEQLAKEHPIGQVLDASALVVEPLIEAYRVPDDATDHLAHLLRHTLGHRCHCHAPRLSARHDASARRPTRLVQILRDLCRLPAARVADDNNDLVSFDQIQQNATALADRQPHAEISRPRPQKARAERRPAAELMVCVPVGFLRRSCEACRVPSGSKRLSP